MKEFIFVLDLIVSVPALLFGSYLSLLTLAALFAKRKENIGPAAKHRMFAVLVPAHDEEPVIMKTLLSLKAIDYPADRFEIVVIADNCTDRTAELASDAGVTVMVRKDPAHRSKGHALRWCLDKLTRGRKRYDAFVIIDADTVASRNLLDVMNNYLQEGADCIQCSDLVAPQPGAWSPEMTRIGFILHNYVRPLGKMVLGLGTGLNGNGMCFSAGIVKKFPWSSYSRVEDLEHSIQLALNGVKAKFAPEAVVHATMPADSKTAETQRRRWELARFPVIRKFAVPLLAAAAKRKSAVLLDMFFELTTPAFVNLIIFTFALLAINLSAVAAGAVSFTPVMILLVIASIMDLSHVLAGLKAAGVDRSDYLVLANFPKYAIWKMSLYFKTWLLGDDRSWIRTQRRDRLAD